MGWGSLRFVNRVTKQTKQRFQAYGEKMSVYLALFHYIFFLSSRFQREGGRIPKNPFSGSANARANEITCRAHGKISREHDIYVH